MEEEREKICISDRQWALWCRAKSGFTGGRRAMVACMCACVCVNSYVRFRRRFESSTSDHCLLCFPLGARLMNWPLCLCLVSLWLLSRTTLGSYMMIVVIASKHAHHGEWLFI